MNHHFTNIRRTLIVALCLGLLVVALGALTASAAPFPAPYLNGFELATDVTACPTTADNDTMFAVVQVASGTNGVTSAGGAFHATAPTDVLAGCSMFSRLGGYNNTFPAGGFVVSIDMYLDTALAGPTSNRLDWSAAINNNLGSHRRDFVFSIGGDGLGGWIMSASNNAPGWPGNPGRDPYTITTSGWYTFQHVFRDNAGVLAVDMNVLDSGGTLLKSWTLTDPTDLIPSVVGGNRYVWLVTNDFADLPLDNLFRSGTCTAVCYADVVNGNDANDGISPATAKKTIQAAINAVTAGGTVYVLPGTYPESPNVNKSLTLVSTGGRDVTVIDLQTGPTYLGSLTISGAEVTVDGFTIEGRDADCINIYGTLATSNIYLDLQPDNVVIKNNRIQVGQIDLGVAAPCSNGDDGFGLLTTYSGNPDVASLTVEDNIFEPLAGSNGQRAYYINPSVVDFTFHGNEINGQFNGTAITEAQNNVIEWNTITGTGASGGFGIWGYLDPGLWGTGSFAYNTVTGTANAISIYDAEDVTVTKNTLDGNGRGVRVLDAAFVAFDLSTIHINRNAITNNTTIGVLNSVGDYDMYGVYIGDTDVFDVDATCNWWGAADGPGPVGSGSGDMVSTDVDYAPFLTGSDLDGLCSDGIFMSTTLPGTTGDGLPFGGEDIIRWDGTAWSTWFDGSAAGLTPTGKWKHNINAFWIPDPAGDDVVISFAQNRRMVYPIVDFVNGMDLVWWDGSAFSLFFDGEDVGLTQMTPEKIDGLHVLPGSASPIGGSCLYYLLISTQGPGRVVNHDGSTLRFGGEDVLGFCLTNAGANTTGFWHMVLDGSAQGMPRNATDSISLSADGQTMYLTTRKAFNVDAAAGGHSMVYAYDIGTQTFSGPIFDAPANGLPKRVDGLHITEMP